MVAKPQSVPRAASGRGQTASRPQTTRHLGPIDACPGCGGHDFLLEEVGENVVFHCLGCDQGWRYELGYVWPVAPSGQ